MSFEQRKMISKAFLIFDTGFYFGLVEKINNIHNDVHILSPMRSHSYNKSQKKQNEQSIIVHPQYFRIDFEAK